MKANEAPEKIYLNQDDGLIWHCRSYKDDIEYTRTDAFIKKTCKFLFENYHGEKLTIRMIENLRRYLIGE